MNPPWWGIPVLLVVGAAVIVAGWWWDRRRQRAASEGFTTEDDLTKGPTKPQLPDAELPALLGARGLEPTLPAGLADRAFLTHPTRGVAAVRDPLVLVTDVELDDERLILPLLDSAHTTRRALVIVAPGFGFGLLGTLRANLLTGRVTTLPVELADPDLLGRAAGLCSTTVVPDADLRAGWWPAENRGTCAAWVADLDDSWVITIAPEGSTRPSTSA